MNKPVLDLDFRKASLLDQSDNGNNGTLTAGNSRGFVNTEKGMALEFDGDSTNIDLGNSSNLSFAPTEALSIVVWIKWKNINGQQTILTKGSAGGNDYEYRLRIEQSGKMFFALYDPTAANFIGRYCNTVMNENTWYQIVITYDGGVLASSIKLYLNNIQVDDTDYITGTYTGMTNNSGTVYISQYGSSEEINGLISKLQVYRKVLSENQKIQLYQQFINSKLVIKPKRNFFYQKSTDLSHEKFQELGSTEIVNNGTFDSDTGWTKSEGVTIDDGVCHSNFAGVNSNIIYQTSSLVSGKKYKITFTISNYSSGSIRFRENANDFSEEFSGNGTFSHEWIDDGTYNYITLGSGSNGFYGDIDNVSVIKFVGLEAAYNIQPVNGKVIDISGNGNDGTINGALSTLKGMGFNGNDYVFCGNADNLKIENNISWELWMKPTDDAETLMFSHTGTNGYYPYSFLMSGNCDHIRWYISTSGSVYANQVSVSEDLKDKLCHLVLTYSSAGLSCYINGEHKFTDTSGLAGNPIDYTTYPPTGFRIAGYQYTELDDFIGEINGAKIYSRVLSLQEIKDRYNSIAKQVLLKEDFSDAAADGINKIPRGWDKGTGSFKIGELLTQSGELKKYTKYLECTSAGTLKTGIDLKSFKNYGYIEYHYYSGSTWSKVAENVSSSSKFSYSNNILTLTMSTNDRITNIVLKKGQKI